MMFQFDGDVAADLGTDEATFVAYVHFWTLKNKANKKHFHDGRYWTYNTHDALAQIFYFLSRRQIQRVVNNCVKAAVIITGNYNEKPTDQTLWYALGDAAKKYFAPLHQTVQCNEPFGALQSTEPCDVYKEQLNTQLEAAENKEIRVDYQAIMQEYNTRCNRLRPCSRMTDKRRTHIKAMRSKGFTLDEIYLAFDLVNKSVFCTGGGDRGWVADFDWILNENNLTKVLEGKYTDHTSTAQKPKAAKGVFDDWN